MIPKDEVADGNDGKFQLTGYRDVLFGILFLFHLVGIGALWIMGLLKGQDEKSAEELEKELIPSSSTTFKRLLMICAASIVVGYVAEMENSFSILFFCLLIELLRALLSYFWLLLVRKYTRKLIIGTLIGSVVLWIGFGVWLLVTGLFFFSKTPFLCIETALCRAIDLWNHHYSHCSVSCFAVLLVEGSHSLR